MNRLLLILVVGASVSAHAETMRFKQVATRTPDKTCTSHSKLRLMFGDSSSVREVVAVTETETVEVPTKKGLRLKNAPRSDKKVRVEEAEELFVAERVTEDLMAKKQASLLAMRAWAAQRQSVQPVQKSSLIDNNQALQILRTLSKADLTFLLAIPRQAVVTCGNGAPAHHLISGKIPDRSNREALRNWVKGGGDWRAAVQSALDERG